MQASQHENEVLKEDQAKQKRQEKFFQEKEIKLNREKAKVEEDLAEKINQFNAKEMENTKLLAQLQDTSGKYDQHKEQYNILQARLTREMEIHTATRRELDDKKRTIEELIIERDSFAYEKSNLAKENNSYKLKNTKIMTERDQIARLRAEAEHAKNITKSGVNALTREIEYLRK